MKHDMIQCIRDSDWRRRAASTAGVMMLMLIIVFGRIAESGAPTPARMVVYAFSTQEEVLTQSIFPAFEQAWEAETGCDLTIEGVFGPSGTLAGQINLGAPADVAILSTAEHVTHLKIGRRVNLDRQPVVIGQTPMVIVTRPGNPQSIQGFSDLAQPGLMLLHADPLRSGAGQWAILAEYGSALQSSGDAAVAARQLLGIWRNVHMMGTSARTTLSLFELSAADAFVTYEHDALLSISRGGELEAILPANTIVAQHVAVIVDDNVTPAELPMAQAFLDFLVSETGQQAFGRYYIRPAERNGDLLSAIPQAIMVEDIGGWSRAHTQLIEGLWREEIEPGLELTPTPQLLDGGAW
jgi:sulfate transport system substrate-binding protein